MEVQTLSGGRISRVCLLASSSHRFAYVKLTSMQLFSFDNLLRKGMRPQLTMITTTSTVKRDPALRFQFKSGTHAYIVIKILGVVAYTERISNIYLSLYIAFQYKFCCFCLKSVFCLDKPHVE